MATITIGIDLAKQMFSVCEMDAGGRVRQRKDFRRDAFAAWLPQVPTDTLVGDSGSWEASIPEHVKPRFRSM